MLRDTLSSRTQHLKDGLNRLFCLVPYDVVTPDIWDHVMPHWMEAIASDVPDKELQVLKILLRLVLLPSTWLPPHSLREYLYWKDIIY